MLRSQRVRVIGAAMKIGGNICVWPLSQKLRRRGYRAEHTCTEAALTRLRQHTQGALDRRDNRVGISDIEANYIESKRAMTYSIDGLAYNCRRGRGACSNFFVSSKF